VLNNDLCSGGECDFTSLNMSAKVFSLFDSNGNANNLTLNVNGSLGNTTLRSPIVFWSGSEFVLRGRNGTTITEWGNIRRLGGAGGVLNITVPDLFNRTNFAVNARGGFTRLSATAGRDGGKVYVDARGWIRTNNSIFVGAGNSTSGTSGSDGLSSFRKDISCVQGSEYRDVDVQGDGDVDLLDIALVAVRYNAVSSDSNYNESYDITCDGRLNVPEIARQGFEINVR
jgi:hypothetical protein